MQPNVPLLTIKTFYRLLFFFFLLCQPWKAGAQLCTGSLGDPVINITFGDSRSPASPLGSAFTDYTYAANDCPIDGSYTIRKSTAQCFGDTWHTIPKDHTGDGGYFMMVNASFNPGNFFVHSISGLCANTTYEFAAWVLNLMRQFNSILPNLTFSIESKNGVVLKTYNTGDLPVTAAPHWEQHGFFFKTPEDVTDIVLKITNNAPGGIGNDLLLDDITFRPCGPNLQATTRNQTDTIHMCEESSFPVSFTADVSTGYSEPVFYWQQSTDSGANWQDVPGAHTTTLVRHPTSPGAYWYRLSAAEKQNSSRSSCRVASNIIVVQVHPTPLATAGEDKIIIKGNESRLGSKPAETGLLYNWMPALYLDSAGSARPRSRPEADIEYTVTTTSAFGCSSSDAVAIKVVEQLYVPNAFTPNGDGRNDVWRIPFLDPALGAVVKVYNRYGELVYNVTGSTVAWNGTFRGKPQPTGTYVYVIETGKGTPPLKGTFVLIR